MPSEALGLAVVVVGTGLAAVIDLRTRRIPNALTGALAVIGIGIAAAKLGPIGLGGALLGPATTVQAFLYTAIIGGVLAVAIAIRRRRLQHTLGNTARLVTDGAAAAATIEAPDMDNRFAYAPAIALGVVIAALL